MLQTIAVIPRAYTCKYRVERFFNIVMFMKVNEKYSFDDYYIFQVGCATPFHESKLTQARLLKNHHETLTAMAPTLQAQLQVLHNGERDYRDFPVYVKLGNGKNYSGVSISDGSFLPRTFVPLIYAGNASVKVERACGEICWCRIYEICRIEAVARRKFSLKRGGEENAYELYFVSPLHLAHYDMYLLRWKLLNGYFDAEERSSYETPEVLHLVSGRDLFGMVCLANKVPEISTISNEMLASFRSFHSGPCQSVTNVNDYRKAERSDDFEAYQGLGSKTSSIVSDAYRHLELHISGRVVATASRTLPRCCSDVMQTEDTEDHIQVFLNLYEDPKHIMSDFWKGYLANGAVGRRIHLGTISGLGSSPDEGCCYVYNDKGTKTHAIMKHRTLMVKHMHWYQVGEKVSVCECRCTRAHLPPSKFWLFEPRCGFHDIGGWYVETYGKDKHGRTKPSQRFWDGLDYNMQADIRLHPAMYLFALAYRTLDLEYAKASKKSFRNVVGAQMFRVIHWCKKLIQ
ncbi:Subtilisin-like protease [Vigna angularis]|uniref:Subtilisin-like protease n=1 Tax=Phaseolus angularis TaxID=3914 RepID=A0A8T0JKK9_PHAAN|nr:Subtilisin-like protease [Vigna angularis]